MDEFQQVIFVLKNVNETNEAVFKLNKAQFKS